MKNLRESRPLRAALFLSASLVTFAGARALTAQEIDTPYGDDPMCGMGSLKLCRTIETCIGVTPNTRCTKESLYFNPD